LRELNFSLFGNKCPALIQEENSDCGMACIAMVLNYYGHYSSIKEIKREFSLGVTGITIQNLKEVADYTKLSARVVKINNFEELNNLVKPTILHWNANHFVVLTKVNSKFITINDPSIGVRKVKKSDFLECFTGYALELFPKNDFKKKKLVKKRVTLKNILSSLYGLEGSVKNAILLTVFVQIFLS
jgi:ATP-binding cassette subfamily B protein RaxB